MGHTAKPYKSPQKPMKNFLFIILASTFVLSACGQKGPLYLPGTAQSKSAQQGKEVTEEGEEKEESEDSDSGDSSSDS